MDFFSKLTKHDQSKPASEPNSAATEPSSTDLFSSAKVVAGAAQSYFSNQPATYENAKVAGATADILDAASEYGKLDKTQGVGKYVDQAESYLKDYEASNTTTAPATDTAGDAGVKSAPATEAAETVAAPTKGDGASTDEPTKPGSYGEDAPPPAGDSAVETDGLSNKASGGGVGPETETGGGATAKTDVSDDYDKQPKVEEYEESTGEDILKKPAAASTDASGHYAKEGISDKPSSGSAAAEADSGDSGYKEDTEEGLPKPSAGGYAAGDDAGDKVSPAEVEFGNFTKVAGDFLNK